MKNTNFTDYDYWLMKEPEEHNPIVGKDWQGVPIHLTDNDDYFDIDDEWVLKDKNEVFEFFNYNYDSVNTYDM